MSKISQSVLGLIRKERLKPFPRWRFMVLSGAIWFLLGISTIAAGLFFGTFLAQLQATDWQLASRWPGQEIGFARDAIGWIWGIGAVAAIVGSVFLFRSTRHGYRYGGIALLFIFLLGSSLLAVLIIQTPLPQRMYGLHQRFIPPRIIAVQFHSPKQGRLLGEVLEVDRDTAFLRAVDGSFWELWLFNGQTIPEKTLVQVFGEPLENFVFAVLAIRPVPPNYSVQEFPSNLRIDK